MGIQIDVWGGDLHQSLVRSWMPEKWSQAAQIIEREVEAGCLCNVLHTDFKCPPERQSEMDAAMREFLKGADHE